MSEIESPGEIMLFGVRVKVDPMRKCVSMNNLSQYQTPPNVNHAAASVTVAVPNSGYVSADDVIRNQSNGGGGGRDRKRGRPWTEEEHKLFLQGLQKVGKGDWRGISRNFVKSRTPTQVASHAQKYFLRKSTLGCRRRRSSLFDITTDSVVAAMQTEEQVKENKVQEVVQPPMPLAPVQVKNRPKMIILKSAEQVTGGSMETLSPFTDIPTIPNLDLTLTYNPSRSASHQVISGLKNGDSMISVN